MKTLKKAGNVAIFLSVAYCLLYLFDPGVEPRQAGSDARSVAQGVR